MIQQPASQHSVNYNLMSLSKLKKIAKDMKIKKYNSFKKENKDDLIEIIKNCNQPLNLKLYNDN